MKEASSRGALVPEQVRVVPLPTPFPVGPINTYLFPGTVPAMVDFGVRSSKSVSRLEQALAEDGLSVEELRLLLLTHPHNDHKGAGVDLAERSGAPLRCHREALYDEPTARRSFLDLLASNGAPAAMGKELELAWNMSDRFGVPLAETTRAVPIEDGETVSAGELELQAVYTPGHAPGHLCFLAASEAVLFCGDLLLAEITPNPLPHFDEAAPRGRRSSLTMYLQSLNRVESLGPLTGLPGHGEPLPDTCEVARKARRHIRERTAAIRELIGQNAGTTVFGLAELHFGEPTVLGRALAFCEVLAHCDLLEDEGEIAVDPETGVASAS